MRIFSTTITLIGALISGLLCAQDFSGIATYKMASKMAISMDSTFVSPNKQNLINQQLMKLMQREFQLTFTKKESNWREVEKLESDPVPIEGVKIISSGIGGSNAILYKNIGERISLESIDVFGKLFLVSSDLDLYKWKMTDETKQIGSYTCYKATAERKASSMKFRNLNGEEKEQEEIQSKTETLTVWYTPEIPVSHGPNGYWGLPGLIMEASQGNTIMVCNKVVLNPKDGVAINIPTKGKKVTNEEYKKVLEEQTEKIREMYGGGMRNGQGNIIEIKSY